MAVSQSAPEPRAPIAEVGKDPDTGKPVWNVTKPWSFFFRDLRTQLDSAPQQSTPTPISETDQDDAIGTTTIVTPDHDGIYSFEYYAAVVTAATTSSSLTVVLGFTDSGVAKTKTFTAITGNTTTTTGSERYMFRGDGGSPITYSTTYASNGANEMIYDIDIVVSSVAAVE